MAHFPSHGTASAAYEKAMRQRNVLLEQGRPDPAWLDALEQRMAEAGAVMATHRADALKRIQAAISGGLTPFAAASFVAWTGGATWPSSIYLIVLATISLAAAIAAPETAGKLLS